MSRFLDHLLNKRALRRWQNTTRNAAQAPAAELRAQRDDARRLRAQLDKLLHEADTRLTRPHIGSMQFPKPMGTDWSWRPDLWRGPLARSGLASAPRKSEIDGQVALFHDCALSEIGLRQRRNARDQDLAPFRLELEVFGFSGSFLSLSVGCPAEAAAGLNKQHLFRVDATIETEKNVRAFLRLSIQHGPNTEQVLRELDLSTSSISIDFDIAHLMMNENRIEKLWLDVIFENPEMNLIALRDLTVCRHYRADL